MWNTCYYLVEATNLEPCFVLVSSNVQEKLSMHQRIVAGSYMSLGSRLPEIRDVKQSAPTIPRGAGILGVGSVFEFCSTEPCWGLISVHKQQLC